MTPSNDKNNSTLRFFASLLAIFLVIGLFPGCEEPQARTTAEADGTKEEPEDSKAGSSSDEGDTDPTEEETTPETPTETPEPDETDNNVSTSKGRAMELGHGSPDSRPRIDDEGYSGSNNEPSSKESDLPADVSKWKHKDYAKAKRTQDPKLIEAVAFIDKTYKGKDVAANKLFQLLLVEVAKPENKPTQPKRIRSDEEGGYEDAYGGYGAGGQPGGPIQVRRKVAKEIVAAIGRNRSKQSRVSLLSLIKDNLKTPLHVEELLSEVIKAMLNNPHSEFDAAIITLAIDPDKIIKKPTKPANSNDEESFDPRSSYSEVQSTVLRELQEIASMEMRMKIAKAIGTASLSEEKARPIEEMLTQEDMRNLPAQIILYKSEFKSQDVHMQLQPKMLQGSQTALGKILGVSNLGFASNGYGGHGGFSGRGEFGRRGGYDEEDEGGYSDRRPNPGSERQDSGFKFGRGRGNTPKAPREEEAPKEDPEEFINTMIAKSLWEEAFTKRFSTVLLNADSLDQNTEELKLLATFPNQTARKAVSELFEKHREDLSAFNSAGLFGQEFTDPAFVFAIKKAAHAKKKKTKKKRSRGRGRDADEGGYNDEDQNQNDLERKLEEYTKSLCARFAEAESKWVDAIPPKEEVVKTDEEDKKDAKDKTDKKRKPSAKKKKEFAVGTMAEMGIRLHSKANIVAEYHAKIPASITTSMKDAGIAPLEVHYIRTEGDQALSRMTSAYKRQAGPGNNVHEKENEGVWMDAYFEDKATGQQRSVDIRIFNDGRPDSETKDSEKRPMIIEILVISAPGK